MKNAARYLYSQCVFSAVLICVFIRKRRERVRERERERERERYRVGVSYTYRDSICRSLRYRETDRATRHRERERECVRGRYHLMCVVHYTSAVRSPQKLPGWVVNRGAAVKPSFTSIASCRSTCGASGEFAKSAPHARAHAHAVIGWSVQAAKALDSDKHGGLGKGGIASHRTRLRC
jgi:hypothetical protein